MRPVLAVLVLSSLGFAQEKPKPVPPPGEAMIEKYFQAKVKAIADKCLTDLTTKEAWEKQRPELRRQFLDMMGLWPLPEKTPLNAKVTGTVEGEGFTVEKLVFESRPGLYVTANVYVPTPPLDIKPLSEKLKSPKYPAILYVCGHGNVVEKGVSYGSKVSYQYHPAWFAKHGYVCIILDTLELGEIPGEHHGTYSKKQWWWQSVGYTPGGAELWNAIRALDYLETRPDVDMKRVGVTGRSGGGATSWWVLAADDRPACFVPVAGIVDLYSHVCEGDVERLKKGVIAGHCDCMYMVNSHQWDFPLVAALAAPKPLLLGNSDADDIFPVPGYRRLAEKVSKVYKLYGAEEKFQLLETKGLHKDTPELRIGINRWMNRWLKNDTTTKVEDDLPPKLTPQQLKVLEKIPEIAINAKVPDVLYSPVSIAIPENADEAKAWWPKKREELLKELTVTSFHAWPEKAKAVEINPVGTVGTKWVTDRHVTFESEPGITLKARLTDSAYVVYARVVLTIGDIDKLNEERGPKAMPGTFHPRGTADTRFAEPGSVPETHIRRRFPLIGETWESGQVWDVRRAIQAIGTIDEFKKLPLELRGEGPMAIVALYASLYEPSVTKLTLVNPPASFRDPGSPAFLGAAKILDHPHAVAMAAATKTVTLTGIAEADRPKWEWAARLQRLTGATSLTIDPTKGK
jgi:dienelactone hydrolase